MGSYSYSPSSVAVGDINGDGLNEAVVGNAGQNIEVFVQDGLGGLVSSASYTTLSSKLVKIADLNQDGLLDVATWGNDVVQVFLQNADGTLDPPLAYSVGHGGWYDLEVGDVNNDGLTDLIVMSGQGIYNPQIGVLTQKAGGFNPAVYYASGGGTIGVGDVNGDGLNDVVNASNDACVLTQNNSGTLNAQVCYPMYHDPGAVEVNDVNEDGRKDIVVLHNQYNYLGIYLQASDGTFGSEQQYSISCGFRMGTHPHALAIGDINGDGVKDIAALDACWGLEVFYR
jgi:hypothetical protein